MHFSKTKFLSLSIFSQHKKCCEIIKKLHQDFDQSLFNHLLELEVYMGLNWVIDSNLESLSNSFHKHLKASNIGISEHDLLIKTHDRAKPLKNWLNCTIYLDKIRSAHNIGNIIRTCEAFRLGKVFFADNMAGLCHPQVKKTSMGAHQHIIETKDLPSPIIAIETHKNAVKLDDFTFPSSFTLVLGNEEFGVSKEMLEKADYIVEVPLYGQKNSLNVAACFAILAHKISNQLRYI